MEHHFIETVTVIFFNNLSLCFRLSSLHNSLKMVTFLSHLHILCSF
uniref:Dihydrolipoyllysine-residue succinyltransferase component of 2-oxoglutarate dehydrogenase complex n=1 Tax=Arundo donax TaxID=35708 RepID=A0A0A9MZS0_ARUDO